MLLILLAGLLVGKVTSQQKPYFNTPKYDRSVSHRSNFCDKQKEIFADLVSLPDALRGSNLSVVLIDYTGHAEEEFFSLNENNEIKTSNPGLYVTLLDELADRAGFTWRDSFGVVGPLSKEEDGNRTWTDLLIWTTQTYDLTVDYFTKNPERLSLEVSFPEGWYDSSLILVRHSAAQELNLLSFLQPFEYTVWLLIVVFIIITGLLYWMLDRTDHHADARELGDKPLGAVFLSAIVFTNHFEFRPNSSTAQLLALSWAFWALITGAAYTANLASFLVNRNDRSADIQNLGQAVQQQAPICVKASTANDGYVERYYPGANLVKFDTHDETFQAVNNGLCELVATQETTFETFKRSRSLNSNCKLQRVGRTEQIRSGGFATTVDTGTLCTSLTSVVLDYHLMQMKADGFIEDTFNAFFDRTTDNACVNPTGTSGAEEDATRLGITDMGGIFILHGSVCVVVLIITAFQIYFRRKLKRRGGTKNENDDLNRADGGVEEGSKREGGLKRKLSANAMRAFVGDSRRKSMWAYPSPSSRPVLIGDSFGSLDNIRESYPITNGIPEESESEDDVFIQSERSKSI